MNHRSLLPEESFLEYFCEISEFSWGKRYFWDTGQNWGKFNFIRILDKNFWNLIKKL